MVTRLAGALLCRDPRCDCWPLPDLSGEAARGMASLRVDAALLDGEPVVRGAAARSFGNAALGDRGIPSRSWRPEMFSERRGQIWQLMAVQKTSGPTVSSLVVHITVYLCKDGSAPLGQHKY